MSQLRTVAISLGWRPSPRVGERGALLAIAAAVVIAWVVAVGMLGSGRMHDGAMRGMAGMPGMPGMPGMAASSPATHGSMLLSSGATASLGMWALMVVAMMVPGAVPAVRHVAAGTLRWRRRRAIATFLVVYLSVWMAFGGLLIALAQVWSSIDGVAVFAVALALATAWQLSPFKRRALRDCHRSVPLPPKGRRATAAVVRFGSFHGFACLRSCWAMMLAMGVASSIPIFWMVTFTGMVITEKLAQRPRQATRLVGVALAVAAMLLAVVAAWQ